MQYSNKRKHGILMLIVLLVALFLCWEAGTAYEASIYNKQIEFPDDTEELGKNFPYLSISPLDLETEMTDAVDIDLSQIEDGYEITEGGQFRLTGDLRGSLVISASEQNVHLFLDNASIAAKTGPAIYCHGANKLVITLLPGTKNTISDSGSYHADAEIEACVYSDCDLTFNGTGELAVNGYYKDAVRSKDVVKILDGSYTIKCKRTGIHGTDGIVISDGDFVISSEKYGLKTTKSGAEGRGNVILSGGKFSIIAGRYAFVLEKANLLIYDCTVFDRSVVKTFDVGGIMNIQEGCVRS